MNRMDDLISRQAAIDAIMKKPAWHGSDGSYYHSSDIRQALESLPSAQPDNYAKGYNDAKREIALSGEYERAYQRGKEDAQKWIPCSERLPENEDIYLVTFDKSNLLDDEIQVSDAYWINNQWQYGVLESYERRMPKLVVEPIKELKVIAWMPLPEPYKGEES